MMRFLAAFVTIVVSVSLVVGLVAQSLPIKNEGGKPVYVGVAFQGETVAEAKVLIDRVKNYTNLFVLGSSPISRDEAATNEVCEYAIANGLSLMVNFGYYAPDTPPSIESYRKWPWQLSWLSMAKEKWGGRFLGVYYDDEPAGIQLDYDWTGFFHNYSEHFSLPGDWSLKGIYDKLLYAKTTSSTPPDYDLEAYYYVHDVIGGDMGLKLLNDAGVITVTSDYGLYWFDYAGGYDVMLAELGWNHSIVQDMALAKGAARLQQKLWGAIVTWKYDKAPYLDSGENIYGQMVQAYQAGASYIMIFNYPKLEGNEYGVMQDEHFAALERFWNTVVEPNIGHPRELSGPDAALVLPKNYGWGMRSPDDRIWGMWGPDDKSPQIWEISRRLLSEYGLRLDIVYDDPAFPVTGIYNRVYYWNESA